MSDTSILRSLLFLSYINYLNDNLSTNTKLLADDTCLMPVASRINTAANHLNKDISKISKWVFKGKISFNNYVNKQSQEVLYLP